MGSTNNLLIDNFLYSHHLPVLDIVLILLREILPWSLMGVRGLRPFLTPESEINEIFRDKNKMKNLIEITMMRR